MVRDEAGLSVAEMVRTGPLTVERVLEVESSRYDLSPAELASVLNGYGVPSVGGRLARHVVVISLEEGWISLKPTRRFWEHTAVADQNLLRYLNLLYKQQDLSIGDRVPLRAVDLALLRASLAIRRDDVVTYMDRLSDGLPDGLKQNKNLLALAAAGIAVAAGAIILLPGSSSENSGTGDQAGSGIQVVSPDPAAPANQPQPVASDPQIDIGTAVVIHAGPGASPQLAESAPASAAAINPQIDIGTALVIERAGANPAPISEVDTSQMSSRGPPDGVAVEPKGSN